MSAKLDKLRVEREKARQKRDEWTARYQELDRKYKEQENVDIHEMVHAACLTPDQLAQLIAMATSGTPAGAIPMQLPENKEDHDVAD